MYILAPLLLILVSVFGIAVIVWRKKTYLDKLYALETAGSGVDGTISNGPGFNWTEFSFELFPEIKVIFDKIKVHKYKSMWLMEAEKFLRRTRLVFMKVDRVSDSLIKKIRRVHVNHKLSAPSVAEVVEPKTESIPDQVQKQTMSPVFLKNEESRLIIEIAKNPKDGKLYESLGDLYTEMANWVDAKESYEASIALNPQNESLKQKLSSVLGKLAQN